MKTPSYICFALALTILFSSCDKVEPPYKETSGGTTGSNDSTIAIGSDTIVFATDLSSNVKKVLAEDYTGHLCGNCPYAGVMLNDTVNPLYGTKLVVISVHAGFFASPCPGSGPCPGASAPPGSFATDFTNSTSADWDQFFGISAVGNPNGMIDRKGYPASHIISPDNWQASIQSESILSPDFKLRIINRYDSTSHVLKTAVQSRVLASVNGNYKLQVVLTEDSIVDWQEWYPPVTPQFDPNYVHRHVLRTAIDGSYGVQIFSGSNNPGAIKLNGFTTTLSSNWNASHCHAVAFVYDAANYKVIQVEEAPIIQ